MATDHIRYDLLAQDALRGVVRRVLMDAAREGLPGEHHFFISFKTKHPGVRISQRLSEKYPEEITIVLQHQFWDLVVNDQFFEVGLSFGSVPERLVVPFEALSGFFDPSVQFGLKFEVAEPEEAANDGSSVPVASAAVKPSLRGAGAEPHELPAKAKETVPVQQAAPREAAAQPAGADDGAAAEKIVSLDTFRKKK
jgi:hypothetical protein